MTFVQTTALIQNFEKMRQLRRHGNQPSFIGLVILSTEANQVRFSIHPIPRKTLHFTRPHTCLIGNRNFKRPFWITENYQRSRRGVSRLEAQASAVPVSLH